MDCSKDAIIEIQGLRKNYGKFQLQVPKLTIFEGDYIGLIGENGAGKSTLIKLILNLVEKDDGVIKLFGEPILKSSLKKEIGIVFDQCNYSGLLCVQELNRIFKYVYKSKWNEGQFIHNAKKHALPLMQPIGTFSQGMKAKLNLITAFAHSPRLILLDEATNNLDPVVRKEINDEIRTYARQTGCTVLFSSHLVNELEVLCNRIFLMNKGRILLETSPEELETSYCTVELKNGTAIPEGALALIPNEKSVSYLTYGIPSCIDSTLVRKGVTTAELMYYLTRGENVR